MTHGTAQDTAQYVTASLIGRQYTVGNQCRYGTGMVRNNLQGYICAFIIVIRYACTFCCSLDNRENQIRFKVRFTMLQYGCQSFKTGAGIDIFMFQRFIGTVRHLIELSEHEIPNFKIPVTVAAGCAIRIVAAVFRSLVKEYFTVRTAWTFADFPEVILQTGDMAFLYAAIVMPGIISLLIIRIYSDIESIFIEFDDFRQKFPCPMNSFLLEVVAEGEIAEHFKKCMVTRSTTYVFKVPCAHTFLTCCDTMTRRYQFTGKERL